MAWWPPSTIPLVVTEPAPGSPGAFREDEFVNLWREMYILLARLNFIRREEILFPPEDTGRHANLDRQHLLANLGMSPEAVSLVERLPYPPPSSISRGSRAWLHIEAVALSYLNKYDLEKCRDPHDMRKFSTEAGDTSGSYLLPEDVALTLPYEGEGFTWILNLKYNAFRFIHGYVEPPSRGSRVPHNFERPDDPNHYTNWPMYHAPSILRRWIQDFLDLEIVPATTDGDFFERSSDVAGLVIGKALRQYGWPNDFREGDWARDSEQIYNATFDVEERYNQTFDPRKFGTDMNELMAQWREDPDLIPDVGMDP